MQNQPKNRLPELPSSDDKKFWSEAEIHTGLIPEPVVVGGAHYFIRKTAKQAQCTHCEWGFELDPGDSIEDGHLYDKKGKLVI